MSKHTVCPRAFRLMLALLSAPRTREECDKLAPSSNSPHYIGVLREKVKLKLPCEYIPFVTSDGIKSRYGRYYATSDDRAKIREYLHNVEATNDSQEKAPLGQG
ncbi:hypothetical protein [Vreelandella neptunia]|uniref:Uncharacterized protein n=1 Tax=Vreelandella neptunia TaxID=115551 RepID=A0ABZ0YIB8_9GAMM|nr:hypothetical protein [Halomonas neptunia]MDN3559803.1 hypothetical protein [Halomonas neptunia]WQH11424.1 hypothetical protein SR894_14810 [Halomonas neptunia]